MTRPLVRKGAPRHNGDYLDTQQDLVIGPKWGWTPRRIHKLTVCHNLSLIIQTFDSIPEPTNFNSEDGGCMFVRNTGILNAITHINVLCTNTLLTTIACGKKANYSLEEKIIQNEHKCNSMVDKTNLWTTKKKRFQCVCYKVPALSSIVRDWTVFTSPSPTPSLTVCSVVNF
jgi:hypothetical protein